MNNTILALVVALLTGCAASAQNAIDEKRPAEPNGIVEVYNVKGPVTIAGTDSNEIAIAGTLGKGSERLDVTGSGSRTNITVVVPKENKEEVEATNLEISVPKGSSLEIECVSGTIEVAGVSGRINLNTVNGAIAVADAKGEAYLKSVNGDIALSGAPTDAEVDTVRGEIDITGATNRVNASAINGSVKVAGEGIKRLSAKTVRGNFVFTGSVVDDASVNITAQRGSIEFNLPEAISASFDLSTFSGTINNSLSATAPAAEKSPTGQTQQFSNGAGSASIRARAFNGAITVKKR